MEIKDLFLKDIFRSINGVVKAEQLDNKSVLQELDEFVVTKELHKHFDQFFSIYSESVDQPHDIDVSGKIGVWVSGFFGSGKSHFIKALSYLFKNIEIEMDGKTKKAIEFYEGKIDDALLLGTIKRVTGKNTDVILFNIDSKADQSRGRDAILSVFLKVLNELQGYSPDHPHIAHMERYLDRQGKLETFHQIYEQRCGRSWIDERDNYMFNQDEIVKALSLTLGQSEQACHRWIDNAESDFSMTVENFVKCIKEYLDSKGTDHRIFFFVDEIGQFIGQDGYLMLNLQTITENLGTECNGRAWIVVTSQEDMDKVLGSLDNVHEKDFSKIQGRFKTRLSLSSANTDQVIQTRILEKKPEFIDELTKIYNQNADTLKNQLTFAHIGMTLTPYLSADSFIKNYPFIPYQFKLLQKIFESIRKAGATGLHLARGERSMLDAFQHAGQIASHKELGILVPLYWFYPSIESFLDTAVKRTIEQAGDNPSLHPFDVFILQTLFMIRYIDEIKGSIDNLVTLCIDSIDTDKLALRKKIEESLHRLEKETLVGRSGENYFFLTNEEQDVSREIKSVELDLGAESRLLGEIIFADIYQDTKKHRYTLTGKDFSINRLCDKQTAGSRIEQGLLVSIITPFYSDYELYEQTRCICESTDDNGCIIIKLPDRDKLAVELRTYLKTEKYIARKNDGNPEIARILRDRKEDNRTRKKRLIDILKEMICDAQYFAAGQKLNIDTEDPLTSLVKVCDYLIENTFNKMDYIEHPHINPQMEVQAVLRRDNLSQTALDMTLPEHNPRAVAEVREYIDLCTRTSAQIVMYDLVEGRFSNRPFGWPEWETVLILARMIVAGEIQLVLNNAVIDKNRINEAISRTGNWRKITIKQRHRVDTHVLESLRRLGQDLFGEMGPDSEDGLFSFFKENLTEWNKKLTEYKTLSDTGNYPGAKEIKDGTNLVLRLITLNDSFSFMKRLNEIKGNLKDFSEDFHDIDNFYKNQRKVWENLKEKLRRFQLNQFELEKHDASAKALRRMKEISEAPSPYRLISEIPPLIDTVNAVNQQLIKEQRKNSLSIIHKLIDDLTKETQKISTDSSYISVICSPLFSLQQEVDKQESTAHIKQIEYRAQSVFNEQIQKLAAETEKSGDEKKPAVKQIKEIRAGTFSKKSYLETETDVEEFIRTLRHEIDEALKNGNRIRIV